MRNVDTSWEERGTKKWSSCRRKERSSYLHDNCFFNYTSGWRPPVKIKTMDFFCTALNTAWISLVHKHLDRVTSFDAHQRAETNCRLFATSCLFATVCLLVHEATERQLLNSLTTGRIVKNVLTLNQNSLIPGLAS